MSRLFLLIVLLAVLMPTFAPADDSSWSPRFGPPGVMKNDYVGTVYAIGYRGDDLYIAGDFDRVGLVPANNIARFSRGQWYALDEGFEGAVADMLVLDLAIYAAGYHRNSEDELIYGVARWHDGNWTSVGDADFNSGIHCLVYHGQDVYVGGSFTMAGDVVTGNVAQWTGTEWVKPALNNLYTVGMPGAVVYDMVSVGDELWAGGDFNYANPHTLPYVGILVEDQWVRPVDGIGPDDVVRTMEKWGTTIYMSGPFLQIGTDDSPLLARGSYGQHIYPFGGSTPDHNVTAIMVREFSVRVATENSLRYHNQFGWDDPWGSMRVVRCLETAEDYLWVGGGLVGPAGYADGVALHRDGQWRRLGGGFAGSEEARDYVNDFVTFEGDLIAGGYIDVKSVTEDVPHCHGIGRWDGLHGWLPLDVGFTDEVDDLIVWNGDLIAAGNFTNSGMTTVDRLARWNSTLEVWETFAGGADSKVHCMLEYDGDLIIGGDFDNLGGLSCENIGCWNGSAWDDLGGGSHTTVLALATDGDNLYASGHFTTIGGVSANHVARWDGDAWHAMGAGLENQVISLCWHDDALWAGRLIYDPGAAVVVLHRWDGAAWQDAATMVSNQPMTEVRSLLSTDQGLVVGGAFETVDGVTVNHAALWDGATWTSFGSGLSGGFWSTSVRALHVHDERLYLGGDFTHAGTNISASIARWDETITPVFLQEFSALAAHDRRGPVVNLDWRARAGEGAAEFRITADRDGRSWPVSVQQEQPGRWTAADRDGNLLQGGEITYRLEGRESGEPWLELGRQTVNMTVSPAWLQPRLTVAPNPANPRTRIELWSPRAGQATVIVHDLRGHQVARLFAGVIPAGAFSLDWDGVDDAGRELASGVYLVRTVGAAGVASARITLVR